jgi:hypothetical protein
MPLDKLKEVPQSLWLGMHGYSKDGICFYMSEYVQLNTWDVTSYEAGKIAASKSTPATIINSGKAKNMLDRKRTKMFAQWATYGQLSSLDAKKVYRIALWFGSIADAPPIAPFGQNHAAVVLTGTGNNVLFFEPNFGFYEATDLVKSRKQLLEDSISGLYAPDVAVNFIYKVGKTVK